MSNQSFSDLPSQLRRERIAAVLALGLARILDQRSKIFANSRDPSLELPSGLRLSVSEEGFRPEAIGLTNPSANRLGCFFCLWLADSRESQGRANWNVREGV